MPMRNIDRERWVGFLEEFSRQHRKWLVNIERRGAEGQIEKVIEEVPLQAIEQLSDDRLIVTLGDPSAGETERKEIPSPQKILLAETEDGAREGLRIEQPDDGYVDIRFRAPARPEQLNGIKKS